MLRKTKIVATIGPACENKESLARMAQNGMDVCRLNFSHGEHQEHLDRINLIREVYQELKFPPAILLDTRGPEIRLGTFENGEVDLEKGQEFTLSTEEIEGDTTRVHVNYPQVTSDISPGDKVLLDDGLIELLVNEVTETEVKTVVNNDGTIKDNKGVNLPGVTLSLPAMTDKDQQDILFGIENQVDFIAASFIRKPEDVLEIRKFLEEHGSDIPVISKIENKEGVENLERILEVSDGLMVARGDLGVDIPPEEVPLVQKRMINRCNDEGKPVITATQMLESMTENPRPTRAEASDVANAIIDGTDAVMLSGETAAGAYPVESVSTMANIAKSTERELSRKPQEVTAKDTGMTEAIGYSTCQIAGQLEANAILTATQSGYTARMVAKYKPKAPIVAVTPIEKVARRLSLSWGVYPITCDPSETTDEMFQEAIQTALITQYISEGDLIVITAGIPVGVSGTTNLIRVHTVGEILVSGAGIGKKPATGKVVKVEDSNDLSKISSGDIVVLRGTTDEMVPHLAQVSGLVAEEGGYTSPSAIVGLDLGLPVIVGAEGALEKLADGDQVTIDPLRGFVYKGQATIL
ncbi:pyruvate kinase [Natranaerobius thermophilus]|uniref:Pyruvate kinase n=1 Tax=Natranaerobius thermophilus (strain ATCC BAA-1301 / DSM 18059 / JW/NM-WN-LF) TaxID=457570 RepID=B2A6D5_NATTJ|nr:pyruvate kinase [Natranaerobius thermophilus]ACB84146.1 pyruvate kinase [Natranaerobius thermophilus JW/NM-WN-LF]